MTPERRAWLRQAYESCEPGFAPIGVGVAEAVIEALDEIERLERLRAWDELPATLPAGLVVEHARLDGMWQKLVRERDERGRRVDELEREVKRLEVVVAKSRGRSFVPDWPLEKAEARIAELERELADTRKANEILEAQAVAALGPVRFGPGPEVVDAAEDAARKRRGRGRR